MTLISSESIIYNFKGDKTLLSFYNETLNVLFYMKEKRYKEIVDYIYYIFEHKLIEEQYNNFIKTKTASEKKLTIDAYTSNISYIKDNSLHLIGLGGYGQIYKLSGGYVAKVVINPKEEYHEYEIPKTMISMDPTVEPLIMVPEVLIKNCYFAGIVNIVRINILIVYTIYCHLSKTKLNHDVVREKFLYMDIKKEYEYLFKATEEHDLFKKSNELYLYIITTCLKKSECIINIKYLLQLINSFKKSESNKDTIVDRGCLIIMPMAKCISVKLKLNPQTLKVDMKGTIAYRVNKYINRMIFLQASLFILKIRKLTNFVHNDLKPDNILVMECVTPYYIKYDDLIFKFEEPYCFKISDFDFSTITEIPNKKIEKTKLAKYKSWFTDIHYLAHKLFWFLSSNETMADQEFFQLMHQTFIYPYCGLPYNKMCKNVVVKNKKSMYKQCSQGLLQENKEVDISVLKNFLTTELFSFWRSDNNEILLNEEIKDEVRSKVNDYFINDDGSYNFSTHLNVSNYSSFSDMKNF